MSVPAPKRDARGRLLPGFTANPSGRPAIIKEVQELARAHVPAAIARLAELANSPNETIALAAIDQLLNRVYGKPVQAVESEVRKFDMAQLYLAATRQANGVVDVAASPLDHFVDEDGVSETATLTRAGEVSERHFGGRPPLEDHEDG